MKTTLEIVRTTLDLLYRFETETPYRYMREVFGKDDPELAEKCQNAPKKGLYYMLMLMFELKKDEKKALAKYINKKDIYAKCNI